MTVPTADDVPGFDQLGLSDRMMRALEHCEYETPSPVQAGVIPPALSGKDVLGQARTGTGKTASFGIPVLETCPDDCRTPHALILVPTRELAMQVKGEMDRLSYTRELRCVALYGGKPIKGQIDKLKRGAPVIVGTPGRVLDHIGRRTLDLRELKMVVLDEADRMLDIGFRPDIERILRSCPNSRQTLLLSATVPPPIQRLANRYMTDPVQLNFSSGDIAVETIDQYYFTVDPRRKFDLLVKLMEREEPTQAIVFCRTKRGTEKIFQRLRKLTGGPGIGCMHGDMAQSARTRMMDQFRSGRVRILVATDVVGRGIDVSTVSHIINYDVPQSSDDYVHRVGRTGRMGREGVAYTFVAPDEGEELTRIEMKIDRLLQEDHIPGFETEPEPEKEDEDKPEPPRMGGRRRRHRRAL